MVSMLSALRCVQGRTELFVLMARKAPPAFKVDAAGNSPLDAAFRWVHAASLLVTKCQTLIANCRSP